MQPEGTHGRPISVQGITYCRLEFICDEIFLRFFANVQNRKNTIAKNFSGYIVIIVVMNFRKKF